MTDVLGWAPTPPPFLMPHGLVPVTASVGPPLLVSSTSPPAHAPLPVPEVPDELRCRYTSKPCANARTTKRGGGLHRFCVFHRARANENQWRVDHRRRLRRMERTDPLAGSRPSASTTTQNTIRSPAAETTTTVLTTATDSASAIAHPSIRPRGPPSGSLPVLIPSDCVVGSDPELAMTLGRRVNPPLSGEELQILEVLLFGDDASV